MENIENRPTKPFTKEEWDDFVLFLIGDNTEDQEYIKKCAHSKEPLERKYAAKNPNTPPETLSMLAKDEEGSVRAEVAGNPKTPQETLSMLAKDKDKYVMAEVARNPNTPKKVSSRLLKELVGLFHIYNPIEQRPMSDIQHGILLELQSQERKRLFCHNVKVIRSPKNKIICNSRKK